LLVVVLLTPPMTTSRIAARLQATSYTGWIADGVVWFSAWREIIGVVIFLTAAATDWLDGFLARRRNEVTTLGILLDPIADKLLTSSAFISLVELQLAPAWMVVVIVGREFAISGMRSVAATRGVLIPASMWGKFKTASQVVAITLLILTNILDRWGRFGYLGVAALWVALLLALGSAVDYFVKFFRNFELEART
jgi:CDP-diacylglycerol--glycerol-3-phosphate 3-phosphatidyltransferase